MRNLKQKFSNFKTKAIIMSASAVVSLQNLVYADASSAATSGVNIAFSVVAMIPGVMGILAVVNAATAFSQSQQEGGNAQASAKMSNNIIAAIVCFAIAAAVKTLLQPLVLDMMQIK